MTEEIERPEGAEPPQKEAKPDREANREADHEVTLRELHRRLGERLSQEREKRGLSLADVSDQLRIRKGYLESLEKGEWSELPEETYVRGFLRQYSGLLALDISEELQALKPDEYHLTKPFTMPDPPIAPSRKWTIAVAAVFVLLFIVFNVIWNSEEKQQTVVPQPQVPPPQLSQPDESPTPPAAAPEQPSATPAGGAATEESPSAPTEDMHRFRFTAVGEDAWIQLFDEQHTLLKEALLKPGDSLFLSHGEGTIFVTCGNAAALEIHADGNLIAAAGSLGESKKVLRDYKLTLPPPPQ